MGVAAQSVRQGIWPQRRHHLVHDPRDGMPCGRFALPARRGKTRTLDLDLDRITRSSYMEHNPYAAPQAKTETSFLAEVAPRPIAVWLLIFFLLVFVLIFVVACA